MRIIRALASGAKRTADEICAEENIPGQFAYKILKKLERAGFLQSTRGRDGGYWLVKQVNTFNLYDIVSSIDSNLFINECLRSDRSCLRNHPDEPCSVHRELDRVQGILIDELRKKTIHEVVMSNLD